MSESLENLFFLEDGLIRMNYSQDNESKKNYKDKCKNKIFLKKIRENIFGNSSKNGKKVNEENASISLNKDKLYETFSLFQQFLNSSKVEKYNDEQNLIGEKIQKFFVEKSNENEIKNNLNNENVFENNHINNINKKEKEFNKNDENNFNIENYKALKSNTKSKNNSNNALDINSYNMKEKSAKNQNINLNLLSSSLIDKTTSNNSSIYSNLKKLYKFEEHSNKNLKNLEKIEKKNNKTIISCRSNYNILEKNKNYFCDYFKEKMEIKEEKIKNFNNKINENFIMKTNSFSNKNLNENYKNIRDIIRNKFKKNIPSDNKIKSESKRNKKWIKESYIKCHSNSCAIFLKNKFLENSINISPSKSPNSKTNSKLKEKSSHKNNTNIINRNKLIFPKKEMIYSKSENCFNNINNKNSNKLNKFKIKKEKTEMCKDNIKQIQNYNDDKININLNINQEINNINYSSEKPIIETNFQKLIKIKKKIDNEKRNNNIKLSGNSYNKSIENIQLEHFSNINNNDNNIEKNIIMTEIKVKKKKNISSKEQIIQAKIKELNEETEKFKEERIKITSLKNEYEKLSKKLMQDIEEFNKKKEEFEKKRHAENEVTKNKKINSANLSINLDNNNKIIMSLKMQNQALIQNSKNDKETIKSLKLRISELENIIKQKDNEIKKMKNNNFNINSQRELINNNKIKINEQSNANKKNKNIYSKKEIAYDIKNLFEKKLSNNNSLEKKKEVNNNSISNNYSKVFFDNLKKNINKVEKPNIIMDNSFSDNKKLIKIKKKLASNNTLTKLGANIKPKIKKIEKVDSPKKGLIVNNANKLSKKINANNNFRNKRIIVNCSERNSCSKKIRLTNYGQDSSQGNNMDLEDSGNKSNNINYNTCNLENNIFKNIKKIPITRKQNLHRNNNNTFFSISKNNSSFKEDFKIVTKIQKINKIKTVEGQLNEKNQLIDDNSEKIYENSFQNDNDNNDNNINCLNTFQMSMEKSEEIQDHSDNNNDFVIINNSDTNNEIVDNKLYDFIIPEKYSNNNCELENTIESDGKKINIYSNNKREILFKSGVKKEIFEDGYQLVYFPNGDKKQHFPDGKTVYYFNDAKTVQTTFADGLNIFKFSNNQIEKHYPDGSKYIIFPNGFKRKIGKDGTEDNYLSDEEEEYQIINKRNKENLDELNKLKNNQLFMSYHSINDKEDFNLNK